MSKQEHDQDEKRAPSGAGKGETPGDASKKAATDKAPAARSGADPQASKNDKGGQGGGKNAAGGNGRPDANKPVTTTGATAKPAVDRKDEATGSAAPDAKPDSQPKVDAAKDKKPDDKAGPGDKSRPGQSGPGKPGSEAPKETVKPATAGSASAASSAGTASGARGGGATPPPASPDRETKGGKAGIVALVLVIVLFVLVILGGWWGWQQFNAQQTQVTEQLSRLSRVEDNAGAIAQLETQLNDLEQQRGQAADDLRNQMQQYRQEVNQTLDRVLAELSKEQEAEPSDWLYAEVEYLLRLANQRLQLERDVDGAISLLQTADQRLAAIDNPALTPVRR
ncbi:MAG: uroporphyrinogen-III C-methyltransferase, partial [Halomonas sp.]|nr:uroporphyrinogen-III C-methyltransferase [Halomonas sp.]